MQPIRRARPAPRPSQRAKLALRNVRPHAPCWLTRKFLLGTMFVYARGGPQLA